MEWFSKSAGNFCQPLCLSTAGTATDTYHRWGGVLGSSIASLNKDNWFRIASIISHSYQLDWHTPWLCWGWINGCILHEDFLFPSGLAGEIKCMHWIQFISNCELTLAQTHKTYSNQTFYGTMFTLCVMYSGIFYPVSTAKQLRSLPAKLISQNTDELPPRICTEHLCRVW